MMIGSGDYNRIEPGLSEQVVIINVALSVQGFFQSVLEVRLIDIGDGHTLGTELLKIAIQIAAASAGPDQAVRQAVVGAESALGDKHRRGGQGGSQKGSAVLFHGAAPLGSNVYPGERGRNVARWEVRRYFSPRWNHLRLMSGQNSFSTCEIASVEICSPSLAMLSPAVRLSG